MELLVIPTWNVGTPSRGNDMGGGGGGRRGRYTRAAVQPQIIPTRGVGVSPRGDSIQECGGSDGGGSRMGKRTTVKPLVIPTRNVGTSPRWDSMGGNG
ncbi:hypothetical protein BDZ91DRAFT_745640 [Kalaharituber pfeilii]|nr:hypothetical protein BDZ91DRAFT_745640 [Kalaharituber pfeilii]